MIYLWFLFESTKPVVLIGFCGNQITKLREGHVCEKSCFFQNVKYFISLLKKLVKWIRVRSYRGYLCRHLYAKLRLWLFAYIGENTGIYEKRWCAWKISESRSIANIFRLIRNLSLSRDLLLLRFITVAFSSFPVVEESK